MSTDNPIVGGHALSAPTASAEMDRETVFLGEKANVFLKQTMKGCIEELVLGCDANMKFTLATMESQNKDEYYATENTWFCVRMLLGSIRPFTMTVSSGGEKKGGAVQATYERLLRAPMNNLKCCCYQELVARGAGGQMDGRVVEDFYYCVPSFKVLRPDNSLEYNIHQPTCMGGVCVDYGYLGACACAVPFNVYLPGKTGKGEEVGYIVKHWGGWVAEIFTDADNYEVRFPEGADPQSKSRMLGATFLVNPLFFERKVIFFSVKQGVERVFTPVLSPMKMASRIV